MLINPMLFVLLALATFRLSHMIAKEEGPWNIFGRLALVLGAEVQSDISGRKTWHGTNVLSKLVLCPLCLSVWVGLILTVAFVGGPVLTVLLVAFAVSGASVVIELWIGGGR